MPLILADPYEKGKELLDLVDGDIRDSRPAINARAFIRNLYFGIRHRKLRYKGQSDIHLHVMAERIEGIVAKEQTAFFAIDPHVHAIPLPPVVDENEAKDAERITNWATDADIPGFYGKFTSWLRNRHLDSVAVLMAWYNQEWRISKIMDDVEAVWRAGSVDFSGETVPEFRPKLPAEVLGTIYAGVEILSTQLDGVEVDPVAEQPLEGLKFLINFSEDGRIIRDVAIEFEESERVDHIKVSVTRPVLYRDNVEIDNIEFEDLIVPFRSPDLQSAERVARKYWLTLSEISTKIRDEGWDISNEEFERLRARVSGERHEEAPDSRQILKRQKDIVSGQSDTQRATKARKMAPYIDNKLLMIEVYATDDRGDGQLAEVIYQIPYTLEKVVKSQYLEEVFPHGHRPFADLHSVRVSNRYYGWSLGQILAPINLEANAIINSVNDAQELINNPFFFYVPTALLADEKLLRNLMPGQGVPIQDPAGIVFPQFPQQPLANLSTLDSILLFADRVTVSPQSMGSSQVRNSPRTARGTLALLGEAGIKIDHFIMDAQKSGWAELMYQIHALYKAYASDETWRRVTGRDRTSVNKFSGRAQHLSFVFKGNTVNTNRQVRQSMVQIAYNTAMSNPLLATDPQAMRNWLELFVRNFLEGENIERFLPQTMPGVTRQPMGQQQESELMRQGVPIDVLPVDDDTEHLQIIAQLRNNKTFAEFTPQSVAFLASHEIQHRRQLMMKQYQGQVQAGGTQANNVPTGISNDLNVLEGGTQ